ncbi:DUF2637 domain-containing protein [Streptomyces antimycoticus]|uniref:DUF2637 domain-containing protein n=1 Tax=Streptomyces antimycoticus TaxID=68175 RepID=UPI00386BB8EC|nr:DUF2637 domain-containing protein [Streptomyces antimycoticus]
MTTTIAHPIPTTAHPVPSTAPDVPTAAAAVPRARRFGALTLVSIVAIIGGIVLGAIGFAGSYESLKALAFDKGFGDFSPWFPIGTDAGIVVLLALDLYLIHRNAPWPLLRFLAHGLTGATIWFNAASAMPDQLAAGMHAVLPILFVTAIEAARRLVIKAANLRAGKTKSEGVPLHRWVFAPFSSFAMHRRMRLWETGSYARTVKLERERTVYRAMLDRKHGSWKNAPSDARLPFTMARYGLSVDEALALPQEAEEAEELRKEQQEARRLDAATRAADRAADADIGRMRARGRVDTAQAQVDGETGQAKAQARAQVATAERTAAVEEEALETALVAEARARTAEAARKEAEHRREQAAADLEAAELERQAAAERRGIEEADRIAATEDRTIETAKIAEAKKRAAEADKAAAETKRAAAETLRAATEAERKTAEEAKRRDAALAAAEQSKKDAAEAREAAAETRRRAAGIELAAVEAEDLAQLKPSERGARKVARMILATGSADPEVIELTAIADALGVSVSTASERRKEAAALVANGYRPETASAGL